MIQTFLRKLAPLLASIFLLLPTAYAASFSDVSGSHEFSSAIEFLAEQKIVNGNPDGTFAPAKTLNRAELIKMVAEGAAAYYDWPENTFHPFASSSCFNDVPANQWYTKYICYGKSQGWVRGYSDNTYRPSQTVTFVEALKITLKGFNFNYTENSSPWYRDGVNLASENNFIPYNVDAFNNSLRRDQMADLITRIVKSNISDAAFESYLGARANIQVDYDSLAQGLDLSKLEEEILRVED